MSNSTQRWMMRALGLLLFAGLCACLTGGGGYIGGVYEPNGYDYGGWGGRYEVGPPRGYERRPERSQAHAYRAAPQTRPIPSIPTRHGRPSRPTPPRPPRP
jgi:hypothetical protein